MDQKTVKKRVIGVDVSLDTTSYAIVDVRGNILVKESFPTEDYSEIGAFVSKLSDGIMTLIEANGGLESIRSVGISAPSANYKLGSIVNSPNFPWKGVIPLSALLRDRLGLAVAVANNSHVVALGEHAFGCARGMRDSVMQVRSDIPVSVTKVAFVAVVIRVVWRLIPPRRASSVRPVRL